MNTKIIGAILIGIVILVGLFLAFNNYIYQQKQINNAQTEPYRATLSGEYVCLPHKNANGPQTAECAFGLKTETDEYYGVDFHLMSQTHEPLSVGDKISATGLITPVSLLNTDEWKNYPIEGTFSVTDSLSMTETDNESQACTMEAKICPDGSAVGRQGPNCEFAACPTDNATSSQITTHIGSAATAFNVTVSPQEVMSDSRCPIDVTCIWAGTVEVRTTLTTEVANGEQVLKLNEPVVFGDYTVELIGVTPIKKEVDIPDESYEFTFTIKK